MQMSLDVHHSLSHTMSATSNEMSSSIVSLPTAKLQSFRCIKRMFRDRGYLVNEYFELMFDVSLNLWKMSTRTPNLQKVLAIFADCNFESAIMKLEPILEQFRVVDSGSKISKSAATGTDFVKALVNSAKEELYSIVILVSDVVTSQGLKYLNAGEFITHFTYDETCIENLVDHKMQPQVFRALKAEERKQFIAKNPRYVSELPRYSIYDVLVKYYGMQRDDIIYIEDNDRQTGLTIEYGLVVEEY